MVGVIDKPFHASFTRATLKAVLDRMPRGMLRKSWKHCFFPRYSVCITGLSCSFCNADFRRLRRCTDISKPCNLSDGHVSFDMVRKIISVREWPSGCCRIFLINSDLVKKMDSIVNRLSYSASCLWFFLAERSAPLYTNKSEACSDVVSRVLFLLAWCNPSGCCYRELHVSVSVEISTTACKSKITQNNLTLWIYSIRSCYRY